MPAVKCNCHENIKTADKLYRNDERISTGNAVELRNKHREECAGETTQCRDGKDEINGYISKVVPHQASGACEATITVNTIDGEHRIQKSDIAYIQVLKNPEQYTKYQQGMEFFKAAQRCLVLIKNDPLVIAYMVNSAFACVIFLKGILDEHSINYGMTHRLDTLFGMLPPSVQDDFIKKVGMDDFAILLGRCGAAFEEFRYLHEDVFAAGKYNLKFWELFVEATKEYAEKDIFQGTRYDFRKLSVAPTELQFAPGCTHFAPKCTHCKTKELLQNDSRNCISF